jgi:hypothetical protein
MNKVSNLNLKSKDFKTFLRSLAKINDTSIVEVRTDEIYSIAASDDRSMFLWSTLSGDFDMDVSLNLPSLSKLSKLLDMVGSADIQFKVNRNNLEYKSKSVKFSYHLYDDGILIKPKITLEKIKALTFDYEFDTSKQFLKTLLSNSSIFKDTNKLYIYTEDDHLIWSLADRTMQNTDTLTVVGDEVDFEMDEFIINLDNVRLIDFGDSDVAKFNVSKNGIGKIEIDSGDIQLNYIISSLTK